MINPELLDYIQRVIKSGRNFEEAKKEILGFGWNEADINDALKELGVTGTPAESAPKEPVHEQEQVKIEEPKKSKFSKVLVAAVVVVLLGGGGAYAYYFYPGLGSPDQILNEAILNTMEVKTSESAGSLNFVYDGPLPSITESLGKAKGLTLGVDFNSKSDATEENNLKSQAEIKLKLGVKDFANFELGSEFLMFGDMAYLKFKNLSGIQSFINMMGGAVDLTSLSDRWVKIDPAKLQQMPFMGGLMLEDSSSSLSLNQKFNLAQLPTTFGVNPFGIGKEDLEKLKEIFKKNQFLKVLEDLGEEEVDGEMAYHFRVGVDVPRLKNFIQEYFQFAVNKLLSQGMPVEDLRGMMDELERNMNAEFDKALAEISKYATFRINDFWITKNSKLIKKGVLGVDVTPPVGEEGNLKIDLEVNSSNFNKAVVIEEPQGATTFEELFTELMDANSKLPAKP